MPVSLLQSALFAPFPTQRFLSIMISWHRVLTVEFHISLQSSTEIPYYCPQLEMVLMVEKLQELRALRIQKLKKQGLIFTLFCTT